MVFGKTSPIKIYLEDKDIELTDSHRLGVVIDKDLNFTDHVEHALGKAQGTFGKISCLLKGRKCLALQEAIEMCKALILPHMESASVVPS